MNTERDKCKKKHGPPPHHEDDYQNGDPCLIMLRKAAVAQRQAILFYLEAAGMVCGELRAEFREVAEDEMRHFALTMRLIAALDCVQAEALEEADLEVLVPERAKPPKWLAGWEPECECPTEEVVMHEEVAPPPDNDMTALCLLTKALTSELEAINMYQTFMEESENSACCRHFCRLMNDKKHHVAAFIDSIYELTCELPLDEDEEDD